MDSTLRLLFRQQTRRLAARIESLWPRWLAGDAQARPPLKLALHTLKGAALTLQAEELARTLHRLEEDVLRDDREHSLQDFAAWHEAVGPWLATTPEQQQRLDQLSLNDLRQALREGFSALMRESAQAASLSLRIEAGWLVHTDFLIDVLPHLLSNALVHGGELPALRLAAGKPERLQVVVDARQRGDGLQLRVADDGRGQRRPEPLAGSLLSGRGWGVRAVSDAVARLPDGRLRFRAQAGRGSLVSIRCRAELTDQFALPE